LAYLKKGPLSEKAVKAIDDIWEGIKHEAPVDNFTQ
jgi:aflatoxin B1 aldehyde reductase